MSFLQGLGRTFFLRPSLISAACETEIIFLIKTKKADTGRPKGTAYQRAPRVLLTGNVALLQLQSSYCNEPSPGKRRVKITGEMGVLRVSENYSKLKRTAGK